MNPIVHSIYDTFSFLKHWVTTAVTEIKRRIWKTRMLLRIATRCCGGRRRPFEFSRRHDVHDGLDNVVLRAAAVVCLEGSHSLGPTTLRVIDNKLNVLWLSASLVNVAIVSCFAALLFCGSGASHLLQSFAVP